jgi:hypothetical protein
MWASGIGRGARTLRLRMVTAAGTGGDGQHTDNGGSRDSDCSVRWLLAALVILPPLWGAGAILGAGLREQGATVA